MTVGELFEVITSPDRLRIMQQDEELYVGFLGVLKLETEIFDELKDREVKKFRAVPEITHRQWKERNLMRPLEPEETPDFSFSDLQMKLYYTIYI